jgi:hypothetical protein
VGGQCHALAALPPRKEMLYSLLLLYVYTTEFLQEVNEFEDGKFSVE